MGLTPNQVYAGTVFDKVAYQKRIRSARIERRMINHRSCPPCVAMLEVNEKIGKQEVEEE